MTLEFHKEPSGGSYAIAARGAYHVWPAGLIWKAHFIVDGESVWDTAVRNETLAKQACDDHAWENGQ